jgi:serine/threonine-protein kinase
MENPAPTTITLALHFFSAIYSSVIYQKGQLLGDRFEVVDLLGVGGFGIVYLVRSRGTKDLVALKTLRDELVDVEESEERFVREAKIWVGLRLHPYILRAHYVEVIGRRCSVVMEYVEPDETGVNSLDGYIRSRALDISQSLKWSIQICHAMEYAYSHGLRCHRDIKPSNILIKRETLVHVSDFDRHFVPRKEELIEKRTVQVSDFGIAGILSETNPNTSAPVGGPQFNNMTVAGVGLGTPTYMSSEQFTDASKCDERSDIYSFGVVLSQMRSGGMHPFSPRPPQNNSETEMRRFWSELSRLHEQAPVPKINSRLYPLIQRCLEKDPERRYQTFKALRSDLEHVLKRISGESEPLPIVDDSEEPQGWINRGASFAVLGDFKEALHCLNRAIDADPHNPSAWSIKGRVLNDSGTPQESILCHDAALELAPNDARIHVDKGISLSMNGRFEEALECYTTTLHLGGDNFVMATAWFQKGLVFVDKGDHEQAIVCCDKAIQFDPDLRLVWLL